MQIESILSPDLTFAGLDSVSKKRVLETIAERIAPTLPEVSAHQIYEAFLAREQLGSTGLGNGIAIPHCRIPKCKDIVGCLVQLKQGIDFDAIDNKPVDILFFLLVPEDAMTGHLEVLRMLAERFSDASYCQRLRSAGSDGDLYQAAITPL